MLLDIVDNSFIAIDSSTKSVAWAYVEKKELRAYGKYNLKDRLIADKLHECIKGFKELYHEHPTTRLIIESPFYGNNVKTVVNLAMIQGVLIGTAKSCGVREIMQVPPVTWQKAIGNQPLTKDEKQAIMDRYGAKSASWYTNKYREVRKQRTIDYVNDRFLLRLDDDDIADSVGIASYTIDSVNWDETV